jgi:hypothetical protein
LEKSYFEENGVISRLEYIIKKAPISNFEFLDRVVLSKKDDTIFNVTEMHTEDAVRPKTALTRGTVDFIVSIAKVSPTETEVSFVIAFDPGIAVPKSVLEYYTIYQLRGITRLQQYFQQLRKLEELDEDDGTAIGEALYLAQGEKGKKSLLSVIDRHDSLRELTMMYEWMPKFLEAAVAIDLGLSLSSMSFGENQFNEKWALELVENHNVGLLADNLRSKLMNWGNEKLAIEAFFEGSAMAELDVQQPWFKSVIAVIAFRCVTEMTRAKWFACGRRALLSAGDVGTDFVTGSIFYLDGDTRTATMLFGIAGTSMVVQLIIVAVIHSYDWRFALKEMFWTLTGLRSGILHKRIITKEENDVRAGSNVITESMVQRGIEVAIESLTGTIVQLSALYSGSVTGGSLNLLICSLLLSCASVVSTIVGLDVRKDR